MQIMVSDLHSGLTVIYIPLQILRLYVGIPLIHIVDYLTVAALIYKYELQFTMYIVDYLNVIVYICDYTRSMVSGILNCIPVVPD